MCLSTSDWIGIGTALATFAAVVAAFIVQRNQAASDRELQVARDREEYLRPYNAAIQLADALIALDTRFDTQLLAMKFDAEAEAFAVNNEVVHHYIGRNLPDLSLVRAFFALRPKTIEIAGLLERYNLARKPPHGVALEQNDVRVRAREIAHAAKTIRDDLIAARAKVCP